MKDITREDNAQWQYAYDLKGQVTGAKKQLPGSASEWYKGSVAEYTYDHSGNRKTAKESGGGTVSGGAYSHPVLTTTYTANALNQYTSVASPQQFDVLGRRASTANTVTVTSSSQGAQPLVTGDYQPSDNFYYAKRITHNSGTYGVLDAVTVAETGQPADAGVEYIPPASFTPAYDADGNLLTDGRWTYTWDGENRLVSQECPYSSNPVCTGQRITYTYDALSRRTGKKIEIQTAPVIVTHKALTSNIATLTTSSAHGFTAGQTVTVALNPPDAVFNGTWTLSAVTSTTLSYARTSANITTTTTGGGVSRWTWSRAEAYLYDGWNMIMTLELNSSAAVVRRTASYVWGPDISSRATARSSWQQAGGVGGLVMILGNTSGLASTHPGYHDYAPLMDRMGNVTALRKLATGTGTTLDAIYEYDAFGRELRNSGPASDWNPFRFSTKFTDDETGLLYYGYRYYLSTWGRWLSRDPIGERGGRNIYLSNKNSLLVLFDYLGMNPAPAFPGSASGALANPKGVAATLEAIHFYGDAVRAATMTQRITDAIDVASDYIDSVNAESAADAAEAAEAESAAAAEAKRVQEQEKLCIDIEERYDAAKKLQIELGQKANKLNKSYKEKTVCVINELCAITRQRIMQGQIEVDGRKEWVKQRCWEVRPSGSLTGHDIQIAEKATMLRKLVVQYEECVKAGWPKLEL